MGQQSKFREQTEERLLAVAGDQSTAISVKSDIVYETSVELMNELLSEPDMIGKSPRLEKISRAVTTLVLNDPSSFSHLFAASHHDFYTATHMVNVATWMVPLAYAMGYHDTDELNHICQAGLLHDIGKMFVPTEILNKKGRLSEAEWAQIQKHPELGCEHLAKFGKIHPLVHTITLEHHERMDGTGYPRKLRGDQMHRISKIAAVVDSFDAMTAFRPFKERTMSVEEALNLIERETPQKYDPEVVQAWVKMLRSAEKQQTPVAARKEAGNGERKYSRFAINCPARIHVIETHDGQSSEQPGLQAVAHNISRAGIGLLSQTPVQPGEHIRIYLSGTGSLDRTEEGMTVRCREYRDGWYEMGIRYAKIAEEMQITSLPSVAA